MADIAKKQNNAKKPVGITETILRDAHQSLIATRMTTEQMLPIVEKMDQVGYHSVECWGGAVTPSPRTAAAISVFIFFICSSFS